MKSCFKLLLLVSFCVASEGVLFADSKSKASVAPKSKALAASEQSKGKTNFKAEEQKQIDAVQKAIRSRRDALIKYYENIKGLVDQLSDDKTVNAKKVKDYYAKVGTTINVLSKALEKKSMDKTVQQIEAAQRQDNKDMSANEKMARDYLRSRRQ